MTTGAGFVFAKLQRAAVAAAIVDNSIESLTFALRGAEALLRQQTPTTMGVRFPSVEDAVKEDKYGVGLYDGAAGVGLVLCDLWRATKDRRFRRLEERVHYGIIESTPTDGDLDPGLFSGHSGIALHHLARAHLLRDRAAFTLALELGARLARGPLREIDIIDGAAGAGLVQLSLYHASGDATFLEGARRIADFLAETAVAEDGVGVQWPARDRRSPVPQGTSPEYATNAHRLFTGLAHGSAGVLVFLLEYVATTRDREAMQLVERGFLALNRLAVPYADGLGWPRSDTDPEMQTHWCHGSAGIAHAYLALHRVTGDAAALERAVLAAEATWVALRRYGEARTCHCHGLSGGIELFVTVSQHTDHALWLARAEEFAARIASTADATTLDAGHTAFGAPCTFAASRGVGLSVGTAGVVRELLRLAGHRVFPILQPTRTRVRLAAPRPSTRASAACDSPPLRFGKLTNAELAELLPLVAAPLRGERKWLEIGPPNERAVEAVVHDLSARATGAAYLRSLERIGAACVLLTRKYNRLLAPNALTLRSFSKILRDIAGMCLAEGADARRVQLSARRLTGHIIDAVALMLRRVSVDLREKGCLRREVAGLLEEVNVIGGDSHRRGQRVISLRFAQGPELVYKARAVAVDRELSGISVAGEAPTLVERCNTWLEPRVAGARLATHRLIDASDWHGYAERVAIPSTCELTPSVELDLGLAEMGYALPAPRAPGLDDGDDKRFWYSAGLLAGFAFSLGAYDLHAENVVMGTSQSSPQLLPHIVDGELAFGRVDGLTDTQLVTRAVSAADAAGYAKQHDHCGLTMSLDFDCAMFAEQWSLQLTREGVRPSPQSYQSASWSFPHVVRNSDGSVGFRGHLCPFLRGFADVWDVMRSRSEEVASHLRAALAGRPSRVLRKATRSYWSELERRRMGGAPVPGRAHFRGLFASRLDHAELRQLDAMDFPYYVRFLGEEDEGRAGLWWTTGKRQRLVPGPSLGDVRVTPPLPFWSIVERQSNPTLFSRAIADVVLYAAPAGPFDFYDPALEVRIVRTAADSRIVAALLLGGGSRQRLTCRMIQDTGTAEYWLE
jgi:hypothetical protein